MNKINENRRNLSLDLLKFIALLSLILAHVVSKEIILQLRNFDVPLLVLISGILFSKSMKKNEYSYKDYFLKRISRLLFPLLGFLFIFSTISLILSNFPELLFKTFTWIEGIGINFLWIIKIFILISLTAVFLFKLSKKLNSTKGFLILISFFYFIYELTFFIYNHYNLTNSSIIFIIGDFFMKYFIFYIFPYSLVFALGISLPKMKKETILKITFVFLIMFIILGYLLWVKTGSFVQTQEYKYPPSIYYFSYSITISLILYLIFDSKKLTMKFLKSNSIFKNLVIFTSSSSLWIYFWHIFYLVIFPNIGANWIFLFFSIAILSILTTYLQKKIILKFINKTNINPKYSKLLYLMFLN